MAILNEDHRCDLLKLLRFVISFIACFLIIGNKLIASNLILELLQDCRKGNIESIEKKLIKIQEYKFANKFEVYDCIDLCDCMLDEKNYNKELIQILTNILKSEIKIEEAKKFDAYKYIGKLFFRERDYVEAKKYYELAIDITKKTKNIDLHKIAKIYLDLGNVHKKIGDIKNAVSYFEKSNLIYLRQDNKEELAKNYLDYSECYIFSNNYPKAIDLLDYARKIFTSVNNNEELSKSLNKMASIYVNLEEYDKAIAYLEKSKLIKSKIYGNNSMEVGMIYDFLGNAYLFKKDYNKAVDCYKKYLDIIIKNKKKHKYRNYLPYKIGACYTNLQDFNRAEAYIDSSLFLLHFDERRLHPFEGLASPVDMIMILYFKAKNFLKRYEVYGCEEDLYDAARWYSLSARLVEYNSEGFEEEDSKQYLLDRFYYVFETTIDAYDRLYKYSGSEQYADSILYYMEKSRAILLKEAMSRAAAINRAGIPDSLLLAERQAYQRILTLENERHQMLAGGNSEESATSLELATQIFDEKEKRRRLLWQIEQLHPQFFKDTYQQRVPRLAEVRNRVLRPNETALQYFIGDDYLFVMAIGQKGCKTFRQDIPDSLSAWITQLREAVYQRAVSPANGQSSQVYTHSAFALYQCLIAPLGELPRRLLILPDGVLEYLPFGALLYEPAHPEGGFGRYPYLLNKHSLRYGQSLAALMSYEPQRAKYRRVLAMAPSFEGYANTARRSYPGNLRNNEPEVQHIGKLFRANLLTGREASKSHFEQSAGGYSVLHLATHAEANDEEGEYSFLAFGADTSNRLYVKNLYALHLPAELVVLSACETGLGELRRGEGLVSLARGFAYAGAGSLVTTLWRVSDRESAELMRYFYEALARRLPKDEALQQAQLQFIKSHELDNRANPFFWAAYVTIGDASPLSIPRRRPWILWAMAALLAAGAWGLQRHISQRKKTAI